MRIESVDFFYLSMSQVLDIADGSQDSLLVRVRAGGWEGWGECEASPLTSIASLVCPMSHSACKPVRDSVLGQPIGEVADIARIGNLVRENSLDLLQADHTLSGIDIALWDLMGKFLEEPVFKLLGYLSAYPKTPYSSMLFGDTPQQTLEKARAARTRGFKAAKFGWGPFGRTDAAADREQLMAAREGLGADGVLLVDAGTVWIDDIEQARQRIPALQECGALWIEEPFLSGALDAYRALSKISGAVKLAGGEGCHNAFMARQMMDYGALDFVQIDTGRIGGISAAKAVADYAQAKNLTFVNHTFTSHLALSASLQPFAGLPNDEICEYPAEATALAQELTREHLLPDANGQINVPQSPGLGVAPDLAALQKYLVEVEIKINNRVLYSTPTLD